MTYPTTGMKRYGLRQESPRKVPLQDHDEIVWRVICGETYQAIADDYGVTRELIRLISIRYDVHASELRYARKAMRVQKYAEEIIYHKESWHPINWKNYQLQAYEFEKHLKLDENPGYDDLWFRWIKASILPYSKQACPDGRVCNRCKVWQPWDEFYAEKPNPINQKSASCKTCVKFQVKSYHAARYVPEPTVTHKMCPDCKVYKPASGFYRATHNNSGLQTYCKECQHKQQRKK